MVELDPVVIVLIVPAWLLLREPLLLKRKLSLRIEWRSNSDS